MRGDAVEGGKRRDGWKEGQIGEVQNEGEINEWEVGAKRQEEGERKKELQGEKDYSQHLWANLLRLLTRILPFLNLGWFWPEHQLVQVWARFKPVTLEGARMEAGWLPHTTCKAGGTGRLVFSHTSRRPKTTDSAPDTCKEMLHWLLFFQPVHQEKAEGKEIRNVGLPPHLTHHPWKITQLFQWGIKAVTHPVKVSMFLLRCVSKMEMGPICREEWGAPGTEQQVEPKFTLGFPSL